MANKKQNRPIKVVLKLPHNRVDAYITGSQTIHDSMASHSTQFPSPVPVLTMLQGHIDDLSTKQAAAKLRTAGAVSARDASQKVLAGDLASERAYVESLVNADPSNAGTIAASAAMSLRKSGSHAKPTLSVKHGAVSGSVKLAAKTAKGVKANEWQYSTDSGKTWIDLPKTTKAATSLDKLTVGASVSFRHRVFTKAGDGDWSDSVSATVV